MTIDKTKLCIALANAQMKAGDIKSICRDTYDRAIKGANLNPRTIGRLAEELGVRAEDLISDGGR